MFWKTSTVNVILSLLFMVESYHIEHNPGKAASYQNVEIKINPHQVIPTHTNTERIRALRQPAVPSTENPFYPKLAFKPNNKQPQGYAVYENQDEGQYQPNGILREYNQSQLNQDLFRRRPFYNVNRVLATASNIASSNRILPNTNQPNFHRLIYR